MPKIHILPSLLAADMGRLEEACKLAETAGADGLHLDIMDGHFVPNLSMGPDVVKMARKAVKIHLSVHLMVTNPDWYLDAFAKAGSDLLLIHVEAKSDTSAVLKAIKQKGIKAGITLNPETPVEAALPFLGEVDEILFMTVHPGFGGQSFISNVLPKIREIRKRRPGLDLSVDGGINHETAEQSAAAGINIFIAGTFLYGAADIRAEIATMRKRAGAAWCSDLKT